jgi:hypothetical protein
MMRLASSLKEPAMKLWRRRKRERCGWHGGVGELSVTRVYGRRVCTDCERLFIVLANCDEGPLKQYKPEVVKEIVKRLTQSHK